MDVLRGRVREFLIVYLILTILQQLSAADKYRRYLRFFSGLILLLFLVSPLFSLFGADGRLEARVAYEAFWEELESAKQDMGSLAFLQNDHYVQKYEKAIAQDILQQAETAGISLARVRVSLSEGYEIENVNVWLDASGGESAAVMERKLLELLQETYRLRSGQIMIQ